MAQWKEQDEDVLTYALFPQVATDFFKYRDAQQKKMDRNRCGHREWSISGLIIQIGRNKTERLPRYAAAFGQKGKRKDIRFDICITDRKEWMKTKIMKTKIIFGEICLQ